MTSTAASHLSALHNSTTVLLEEANNLGKVLLDLFLIVHLLCSLLLLLVVLLVALLLRRVSLLLMALLVSKRIGSLVLRLAMVGLVVLLGLTIVRRRDGSSTSEVDIDSTFVVLGMVLEALLLADLLDTRLDLLDVIDRVIALADNAASAIRDVRITANMENYSHMQMVLAGTLCVLDSLFQNLFGLFHELTVKVNGIPIDSSYSIVLAEDEFGSLSVVVVCLLSMVLGLLRQIVSSTSVSTRVCLLRLGGIVLALAVFLARKISQSVVFGFRVARLLVVEG